MTEERGLIILAGGRASRLGGVDKAFIKLNGKPLIKHIIERVRDIFSKIVVVIQKNGDKNKFNSILLSGLTVAEDAYEGKGPLSGIISGINNLQTRYAAVIPCDTPFVNPRVVKFLFQEVEGFDAAIPIWPNGFQEPLQAVYRSTVAVRAATDAVESGELSIIAMIRRLGKVKYVQIEKIRRIDAELDTFFNINTNDDLKKAREKTLKSGI